MGSCSEGHAQGHSIPFLPFQAVRGLAAVGPGDLPGYTSHPEAMVSGFIEDLPGVITFIV